MSNDSILNRIERDAQKALVQNAFFRWESAVMIAGTILLSVFLPHPFPGWPVWGWPVLGVIGEAAIVISSLTDKAEQQRVVEALFREQYSFAGIRDRDLRAKLAEAEQYRQRVQQVVEQQRSGLLRDRLKETTAQVYDWIANMVLLARRIDAYRNDPLIKRDLESVPKEIEALTQRLSRESNPRLREQMVTTLESSRRLEQNLRELASRMERADLQLDHSLAALGTVYSQLLLIGSRDVNSERAERLHDDIRSEVLALQELVESLNEVYTHGLERMPAVSAPTPIRRRQAARR